MLIRPRHNDFKIIVYYTGKVVIGLALLMTVPLAVAIAFGEWNPAIDFLIAIGACMSIGLTSEIFCETPQDLRWSHGLVIASFSWFAATVLGAIPHWLSRHFGSLTDAMFDVMSGYTTTGLYLIQDLDHISNSLNMWRHLLTYAGGQGIIVVALTFLLRGSAGAYKMYVGEGKDERLLPNVIRTARAIWLVSLSYLVVGSVALWITGVTIGQSPLRSLLHAVWVFMGAWSTGGFAPQSYNTFYYHSLAYEVICAILFVVGSFNFALHWSVWTGRRSALWKDIEMISFTATLTLAMIIATTGLMQLGVYTDTAALFRKMFYQLFSGHTTTGFSTIYSRAFVRQWGPLAMMGVILAMAIGASACSTAGGVKGIRVGVISAAILQEIRRMILPEKARVVQKWHHITTRVLDDATVRAAMLIVLSYIAIYSLGTIVGVYYGYDLMDSLFDSVSAGSNTGLSCGLTSPSMPTTMKIVYIFMMWAGRLEFLSVFALAGYVVALVKGR
jgi:trk system potassium uptake protein TrkH